MKYYRLVSLVYILSSGGFKLVGTRAYSGCEGIHTKGNLPEWCTAASIIIHSNRWLCTGSFFVVVKFLTRLLYHKPLCVSHLCSMSYTYNCIMHYCDRTPLLIPQWGNLYNYSSNGIVQKDGRLY